MEKTTQKLLDWAREGAELSPPAWDEFPDIPLYMDQVILYLGDTLRFFQRGEESLLTSSMINNYVKNGVLPHPEKKKYGKEHLASLTALCMLKQVLPIQDVKALSCRESMDPTLYELFRRSHTAAVQETCRALEQSCAEGKDLKEEALRLAAEANAKRAAAQRILWELEQEEKAEGKQKK